MEAFTIPEKSPLMEAFMIPEKSPLMEAFMIPEKSPLMEAFMIPEKSPTDRTNRRRTFTASYIFVAAVEERRFVSRSFASARRALQGLWLSTLLPGPSLGLGFDQRAELCPWFVGVYWYKQPSLCWYGVLAPACLPSCACPVRALPGPPSEAPVVWRAKKRRRRSPKKRPPLRRAAYGLASRPPPCLRSSFVRLAAQILSSSHGERWRGITFRSLHSLASSPGVPPKRRPLPPGLLYLARGEEKPPRHASWSWSCPPKAAA